MYDVRARKNLFLVYTVFLGLTLSLWVLAKPSINSILNFPLISVTQILGLTAATLVSLNLLLASRLKIFENLFGGLDKVYKQHQFTGKTAFALMLAHPTFLLLSSSDLWRAVELYVLDLSTPAYNYGKLALFGFTTLITLTIFVRLPYHIWRITHQLMIIPLIFLTLHVATIPSDVAVFLPLRVWILGLLLVGIGSYIYKVILYKHIGPKLDYKVNQVNLRGQITEVLLEPQGSALSHEPGQFVFVIFGNHEIGDEEHPFSISSAPGEKLIRLSIKKSGDFTSTLPKLKAQDKVKLYGPYGAFGRIALVSKKEVVMIAGGIGITPFLSIVNYIKNKNINLKYKLIYSYKNETDSSYKEELMEIAGDKLVTHNSDRSGHLTAKSIADKVGGLTNKTILLCGPKGMMSALTSQFLEMGVKRRNIIFEDFDLKG
ncbi:hypothetical protein A2803_05570 [Candidatus Woesebacteria bacterium RIFCSPHIGHO2_01_FULL_44_21]|uniref:FAD-binding FR-type domain-containing protein n=1 Tax=Candidatus Woesebacteria bacterium RIFCSPHIGHO2_01_FULL_44_21 TaxID=1802503 RepID=A0A1F7Z0X7_9BACT|nr:MAG: hypothetical protein A2803_05570 [Candidatus Woesebacteria bacterium RIFCSPHIGHO2_01_FULL_44_21]